MNTSVLEVDLDLSSDGLDDNKIECLCSNWLSLMINLTKLELNLEIKFGRTLLVSKEVQLWDMELGI